MESHVDVSSLATVCKKVCRTWDWTSNGSQSPKGTRIIIGWNRDIIDLMVIAQTSQVIHVQINFKVDNKALFCSFVYANNYYRDRRELWDDLCTHKRFVNGKPWVIMGDFNSSLNIEDNYTGSSNITTGMRDFKACVEEIEVFDINSSGLHYTWNQKPKRGNGVFKKIDRVMGNISFTDSFPSSCALFQPYRVSDHTPCILKLPSVARDRPKPFKFANFLVRKEVFWKLSKKVGLLLKHGNLHKKVELLRSEIDDVQKLLDRDPSDEDLRSKEAGLLKEFRAATLDEEEFL
uniref:uncharacterized protein LOC122585408 n=1 Tax=Erigeron canadensis TaxID=72917 RepID=UPI001CB90859|nr:uncharacterized protein LOC122585408 [Erigeron canadensis]